MNIHKGSGTELAPAVTELIIIDMLLGEEEMATHTSTFTWRIPWTEGPGELQYVGSRLSKSTLGISPRILEHERLNCLV